MATSKQCSLPLVSEDNHFQTGVRQTLEIRGAPSMSLPVIENCAHVRGGIMSGLPFKSTAGSLKYPSTASSSDTRASHTQSFSSNTSVGDASSINIPFPSFSSTLPGIVSGIPVCSPMTVTAPDIISGLPVYKSSVAGITSGHAMSNIRRSNSHGITSGRPAFNMRKTFDQNEKILNGLPISNLPGKHLSPLTPGITSGIPLRKTSHDYPLQISYNNSSHYATDNPMSPTKNDLLMDVEHSNNAILNSSHTLDEEVNNSGSPHNPRRVSCPTYLSRHESTDDLTQLEVRSALQPGSSIHQPQTPLSHLNYPPSPYRSFPHNPSSPPSLSFTHPHKPGSLLRQRKTGLTTVTEINSFLEYAENERMEGVCEEESESSSSDSENMAMEM